MLKSILLSFSIVLCFTICSAQEPILLHITQQDGLSSNTIYDIYRDSKGFLWFGTDNGAVRFNGIRFEKFSTLDGLPDNEIFFFQEDYEQRLWISTFNGQLCYYKDGIFHNPDNTGFLKLPFKTSDTKFIKLHRDSSISIAFFNQPDFFINIKGDNLKRIDLHEKQSDDIRFISKLAANKYNIQADSNSIFIDSNGRVIQLTVLKNPNRFSYVQDSCYQYNQNGIYNTNGEFISVLPGNILNNINRIFVADGETFICTRSGLYLGNKRILHNQKISSITRDLSGNYWIGTLNNGVYVLKNDYSNYQTYNNVYTGTVKYCVKYKGGLLFSTSANKLYELRNNTVHLLSDFSKIFSLSKEAQSYATHYIDTIGFYCFSAEKVFAALHHRNNTAYHIYHSPYSTPKHIISLKHNIYLLSSTNISCIVPQHDSGTLVPVYAADKNARLYWMAPDGNGNIWYTGTNNTYKIIEGQAVPQNQFSGIQIKWFDFFDKKMVAITNNNKLIITNNINDQILRYTTIKDDCIWTRAYKLDDQHILVSTNNLYRLVTLSPKYKDGYRVSTIDNEFIPRDAEYIEAGSNTIHFFKNGNIHTVSLTSLLSGIKPPVVWATALKTQHNRYDVNTQIRIPYKEAQNITINFNTLSFGSKHIGYEYSVSRDEDTLWHHTQNEEINIYTPAYGTYNVKIRAVTESGIFSEPYTFSFTVLKPFYATWGFIIGGSIFIITCIIIAVRLRIRSLLNKREHEHDLKIKFLKSEYKALNALMNPHFIFNSLNNIQGFINKGNKVSANSYLNTFSKLVRQNMHNVSKETIILKEEIELIQHYLVLEKMRFKDQFNYDIDIEEGVDVHDIFIPPLLIQPFIENAIKHGLLPNQPGDNMLWIRFYTRTSLLHIEIEDNGIGFNQYPSAGASHTSYALTNIRTRISQLNEMHNNAIHLQIENRANNLSGTKVIITLDIDALS